MLRATDWEFKNRALLFGLIFGLAFPLYSVDPLNSAAVLANWLEPRLGVNADLIARFLFALATLLLVAAASIRTWASSYLRSSVVYAAEVKSASLVADGPYRRTRNPLYFANVLMAVGMGTLMSRSGFFLCVLLMVTFCYRLIMREEAELALTQGETYEAYRKAVPRFLPSLRPRIASSGSQPNWKDGFKAEFWYWGFAAAIAAFAITLSFKIFLVVLGVSIGWFWISSAVFAKK